MDEQTLTIRPFEEVLDDWRKYCEYWKSYPDRFIDFIRTEDCPINLFFYQRIMLRVLFRYKNTYLTFTRGTAKSYTQILAMYLKAIMYPRTVLFLVAPGKEQAASITKQNVEKIWTHFPILKNELVLDSPHAAENCSFGKDYVTLRFRNGSKIEVIVASEQARGGRNNGGAIEEIVDDKMKREVINDVILPRMADDRLSMYRDPETGSSRDPYENHKFVQIVTTAGTRQSYAFEKLMEVVGLMAEGKSAYFMGAGYELPCMHGHLSIEEIMERKEAPTTNPLGFAREYESVWTGSSDNSLVNLDDLTKCRVLRTTENKHSGEKDVDYILSYDVARAEGAQAASCALCVIKIKPRGDGTYVQHLVNIYSFKGSHFREQALFLKRKVNDFKARMLVVDANGVGKGLVDYLVLEIDENPPYSVVNDETWDRWKLENSLPLIYAMSTNKREMKASDIHSVFIQAISQQRIKMPYSESQAIAALPNSVKKDAELMVKEVQGFRMVDLLCEEIMNLEHKQNNNQIIVEQISKKIQKDKFSAFEYCLWYIYTLERENQIRRQERGDAWKYFAVRKPRSIFDR